MAILVFDQQQFVPPDHQPKTIKLKPRKNWLHPLEIDRDKTTIVISKGRNIDLQFNRNLRQVDGHDPDINHVIALTPSQLRVSGSSLGKTTFIVKDQSEKQFEVEVEVVEDKSQTLTRDQVERWFKENPFFDN